MTFDSQELPRCLCCVCLPTNYGRVPKVDSKLLGWFTFQTVGKKNEWLRGVCREEVDSWRRHLHQNYRPAVPVGALGQLPPKVGFLGLVWVQSNSAPVGQKWVRECPLGVLPLAMCLCYVEIRNNLWLVSRPGMPNIWVAGQTRSVTGAQSGPCTCLVKFYFILIFKIIWYVDENKGKKTKHVLV